MDSNDLLFFIIQNKIPIWQRSKIRQKLPQATRYQIGQITQTNFKDSRVGLMYSLLFGFLGLDRLYKGNKIFAFLKPLMLILAVYAALSARNLKDDLSYSFKLDSKFLPNELCNLFVGSGQTEQFCTEFITEWFINNHSYFFTYGFVYLISIYLAWVVLDIFLVYIGIKMDNARKILKILRNKV